MTTRSSHHQAEQPSGGAWPRALSTAAMQASLAVWVVASALTSFNVHAAEGSPLDTPPAHKLSVSSTYMTVTNPFPNSVSMYELHVGYRLTARDVIAVKACSWKLFEPMGIPLWDPHLQQKSEFYPGKIHEFGVGLSYQRFLWEGLFVSIQVVPLKKRYLDHSGKQIGEGFKLYTSYHLGYQLSFLGNRFYVDPQIHINYWPMDSRGPDGFEAKESKWPKDYFLFEPNLFLGVNL